MSPPRLERNDFMAPPVVERIGRRALIAGAVGAVLLAIGVVTDHAQFLRSYLLAYFWILGIALGSLALLMLQFLTGGNWGFIIRRLLEAATRTLPLLALLFLPVALGVHELYTWARPELMAQDPILQQKQAYLNLPFFFLRAFVYFAAWLGLAYLLNKWSAEQDEPPDREPARKFRALSAPGIVVYGLTITFASIDWAMSLDPHWFSTMFPVLFMGGQVLSGLAFAIAMGVALAKYRPLSELYLPGHVHDLGKLLLAFVMLWAYFAFSQYLIIWSANLPEEIPWYLQRLRGGWEYIALGLVLFHFALPFALLLSRDLKRNARRLAVIAAALLGMRLLDLFWMVAPTAHHDPAAEPHFAVHWLDLAAPLALGGLWLWFFSRELRKRPLVPLHDARLPAVMEASDAPH